MIGIGPEWRVDESGGIADYYRHAFRKCENCSSVDLADGIVCVSCSIKLSSVVPEGAPRVLDFSEIARLIRAAMAT